MSQELISRNHDLKKLRDEGRQVEVRNGLLLVHGIPYVNSEGAIKTGMLVSELTLAGDKTTIPGTHVINFAGDYPCNKDGSPIKQIQHQSKKKDLGHGVVVDHSFSNKPPSGYADYFEKITTYIAIISSPAKSLDSSITEKTFNVIEADEGESVFNYIDTNSSRAEILGIASKIENQKVAVVGLGGTGAYILDLVAKTPVREIHLFDGDNFLQHNAFRSPGAPPKAKLDEKPNKASYFKDLYSPMHRGIFAHPEFLTNENIDNLSDISFVFICIDKGKPKKTIINKLVELGTPFIDVGMGVHEVEGSLMGIIRTTTCTKEKHDHIHARISFADPTNDEYATNIQISELNSLNAALAVLKWKKIIGFYQDLSREHNSTYTINTGQLINEDEA